MSILLLIHGKRKESFAYFQVKPVPIGGNHPIHPGCRCVKHFTKRRRPRRYSSSNVRRWKCFGPGELNANGTLISSVGAYMV
jgi:hypothetical protein